MKSYFLLVCFVTCLNVVHIQSQGSNLSFETNNCNSTVCGYPAGSTSIPGWTVSVGDVDLVKGPLFNASEGSWSVDMNGADYGGLYQTITTTVGTMYNVTFYMAGNPTCDLEVKTLSVVATGSSINYYDFDTTGHTISSMGWTPCWYSFVATSASTTITFLSETWFTPCGPALDAISILQVASPSTTPSRTPSPSMSATPSVSATPSRTPSVSSTPSVSPSSSVTPSPSGSATPSITPSPSLTPSATASASPTSSATPTASVTPTSSATPTASATPSTSDTPSPVQSISASPSKNDNTPAYLIALVGIGGAVVGVAATLGAVAVKNRRRRSKGLGQPHDDL